MGYDAWSGDNPDGDGVVEGVPFGERADECGPTESGAIGRLWGAEAALSVRTPLAAGGARGWWRTPQKSPFYGLYSDFS